MPAVFAALASLVSTVTTRLGSALSTPSTWATATAPEMS
jgi:hypothetical protein